MVRKNNLKNSSPSREAGDGNPTSPSEDGNSQEKEFSSELQGFVQSSLKAMYKNRFQRINERIDNVLTTISSIDRKVDEMHEEMTSKIHGCNESWRKGFQNVSKSNILGEQKTHPKSVVTKLEKKGNVLYKMSFPKELLVSGDRLKQISEEDVENIPTSLTSSSQPGKSSVEEPKVERKAAAKAILAEQTKSHKVQPPILSSHKRSNSKNIKQIELKGLKLVRKKSPKEMAIGEFVKTRRKPNKVSKEYKETGKLKNVKVQKVIAKDYKDILSKFPAQYKNTI